MQFYTDVASARFFPPCSLSRARVVVEVKPIAPKEESTKRDRARVRVSAIELNLSYVCANKRHYKRDK